MEDFSDLVSVPGIGIVGLVTMFVILVYRGVLTPRSTVTLIRQTYEDRLADKDAQLESWKDAYNRSEAARAEQAEQLNQLVELAKTTDRIVRALPVSPAQLEQR